MPEKCEHVHEIPVEDHHIARALAVHVHAVESGLHRHPGRDERVVGCVVAEAAVAEDERPGAGARANGAGIFGLEEEQVSRAADEERGARQGEP